MGPTIPKSPTRPDTNSTTPPEAASKRTKLSRLFQGMMQKLTPNSTTHDPKIGNSGMPAPDLRETPETDNSFHMSEQTPSQTPPQQHKTLDFSEVKAAFSDTVESSLRQALTNVSEVIQNPANTAEAPEPKPASTNVQIQSLENIASSFARGAFNQVSNNAMIGNGYSYDYIPDAMVNSDGTIDQGSLKEFHVNMIDKLLTRLAGIDMKIDLNTAGMQHVSDAKMDLSFLQKNRLTHFGRNLANRSSNTVNNLVLKQMRRTVIKQIRNESLRAGQATFEATKNAMSQHYSQQTSKPNIDALFTNKGPLAPDNRTNTPDENNHRFSFAKIQAKASQATPKIFKDLSPPNIREATIRTSFKLKNPRQSLVSLGGIQDKPVEQGLLSKTVNAHKALYGIQIKSLDTHIDDAQENLKLANDLKGQLDKASSDLTEAEKTLNAMQKSVAELPKGNISGAHKQDLAVKQREVRNLKYTESILSVRAKRAEKAYKASVKEVVRYTSPSKFEKKIAEHGFHTNNERGAPNKFLSGQKTMEGTFRGKLMHETHQLIARKSAAKNAEQLKEASAIKAEIKINAALIHAPKNPLRSFKKIVKLLDSSDLNKTKSQPGSDSKSKTNESAAILKAFKNIQSKVANIRTDKDKEDILGNIETFSQKFNGLLENSTLSTPKKAEIRQALSGEVFSNEVLPNETFSLKGLFDIKGEISTKQALALQQEQESVATYRAIFSEFNNSMKILLDPQTATQPERKEEALTTLKKEIVSLMSSSETADEVTGTYNTLVASLSRILGDPRASTANTPATQRSREIRNMLPPLATSTGGMFLESTKTKAVQDMATHFPQLVECLGTSLEGSSMLELSNIESLKGSSEPGDAESEGKAVPKTVQDLLRSRALMSEGSTLDHVEKLFETTEIALANPADNINPPPTKVMEAAQKLNTTLETLFKQTQADDDKTENKTVDTKALNEALSEALSEFVSGSIADLNTLPGVEIKPNSRIWNPLTGTNERSIQHHVKILSKAIQQLAQIKENGIPVTKPETVRQTVFKYLQADFEHQFRRTDLDTSSLRDRLLWGQNSPASIASSDLLATAIGDLDAEGASKGIEDPGSIMGTLQKDFNRTVNMPAQVITQGVVNAALIGSAFGSVGALAVGRPELLVLPLPLPFLNGGDWISMSFASIVAAVPLSGLAVKKAFSTGDGVVQEAQQQFESAKEDAQKKGDATLRSDTASATRVSAYPKQLETRNDATLAALKTIDQALKWVHLKPQDAKERPGYYPKSVYPEAGEIKPSTIKRLKKLDIIGSFDLSGKLAVSWQRQALRILDETRLNIGQSLLAPAITGIATGAQLIGRMIANDFGAPESPTHNQPDHIETQRVDDADVFLARHLAGFQPMTVNNAGEAPPK